MVKRIFLTLAIVAFIAGVTTAVIVYGRGYRFNFQEKSINPTGILSASSYPERASIWVNDKLVGTTNASISLNPGSYNVRISREGYQSWEKKINIQGEIVNQIDALLIPANPSLSTLTVNGVTNPVLSPGNTQIAFLVARDEHETIATNSKAGIWISELRNGAFGGKSEPRQLYQSKTDLDPSLVKLNWSADEKNLLVSFMSRDKTKESTSSITLLETARGIESAVGIPTAQSLLTTWQEERLEKEQLMLATFPPVITAQLATVSGRFRFSADETKLLYTSTASASLPPALKTPLIGTNSTPETRDLSPDTVYVYDKKEDKNYRIAPIADLQNIDTLQWYSDSKHIIMVEKDTIYIVDYDGTNKRAVYGGPFEKTVVFSWPGGPKLVILTNLNNPKGIPNLYLIDLT